MLLDVLKMSQLIWRVCLTLKGYHRDRNYLIYCTWHFWTLVLLSVSVLKLHLGDPFPFWMHSWIHHLYHTRLCCLVSFSSYRPFEICFGLCRHALNHLLDIYDLLGWIVTFVETGHHEMSRSWLVKQLSSHCSDNFSYLEIHVICKDNCKGCSMKHRTVPIFQTFKLSNLSLQLLVRWSIKSMQGYMLRYKFLALFISIPQILLFSPTPLSLSLWYW